MNQRLIHSFMDLVRIDSESGNEQAFLSQLKQVLERCGLVPKIERMMGGTDAAVFNEKGIQMVVMGMGVRRPHTVEEHVNIQEMEKMVEVLQAIFADLCTTNVQNLEILLSKIGLETSL